MRRTLERAAFQYTLSTKGFVETPAAWRADSNFSMPNRPIVHCSCNHLTDTARVRSRCRMVGFWPEVRT
eukprot:5545326-Alexandrium_andersonii.AAC.1